MVDHINVYLKIANTIVKNMMVMEKYQCGKRGPCSITMSKRSVRILLQLFWHYVKRPAKIAILTLGLVAALVSSALTFNLTIPATYFARPKGVDH